MQAVLVVDQADVDYVAVRQPVDLLLEAFSDQSLTAKIEEIAATNLKIVGASLTNKGGGDVATAGLLSEEYVMQGSTLILREAQHFAGGRK